MIRLELKRKDHGEKQTRGMMDVYKNNQYLFSLCTLEPAWKNNDFNISCIPYGMYPVEKYSSEKHPNTFKILNTDPRTDVLIHIINYYYHTKGCIGVGLYFGDINNDGLYDLASSGKALGMLYEACENEEYIYININ